jgi:hypothetical protein
MHNSFIHSALRLTTGPQPLTELVVHRVRYSASSFDFQYALVSLKSYSRSLRLLLCLLVVSISPSIFLQQCVFKRQFLRKMPPIQLAFHLFIVCRILLFPSTPSNTFSFMCACNISSKFIYDLPKTASNPD